MIKSTVKKLIFNNPTPSQNPNDPPRSENNLENDIEGQKVSVMYTVWSIVNLNAER